MRSSYLTGLGTAKWTTLLVNTADKSAVEWKVNSDLLRHNVRVTWNGMKIADIERRRECGRRLSIGSIL